MSFESVRGYVGLASGVSDLARARAKNAAQVLLSLPVAGITTGGKLAVQGLLSLPAAGIAMGGKVAVGVGTLAEELFATATANRSNLKSLVRSEVDVAVTRLGLVSVQTLAQSEAEAARLRAEVARLRAASLKATPNTTKNAAAARTSARRGSTQSSRNAQPVQNSRTGSKASTSAAAVGRSAVTTRARPAEE